MTRKTDEVIFDDTTEPTTEDTTVVTVVSIVVATAVGLLVVFVSIFATWLLRAMYCSSYGLPGSMFFYYVDCCFCLDFYLWLNVGGNVVNLGLTLYIYIYICIHTSKKFNKNPFVRFP